MDKGGIGESGHYRCFFCDGRVIHKGSDMAVYVYDESGPEDVLHYMRCARCGAEYEVIQPNGHTDGSPMGEELRLRKQIFMEHDDNE